MFLKLNLSIFYKKNYKGLGIDSWFIGKKEVTTVWMSLLTPTVQNRHSRHSSKTLFFQTYLFFGRIFPEIFFDGIEYSDEIYNTPKKSPVPESGVANFDSSPI